MVETFLEDVRYGLRAMLRARGLTAVAVLTLALGIAASTAILSVVEGLLLRPLPVRDPDRVTVLYARSRDTRDFRNFSYADYGDLRQVQGFESLAAVQAVRVAASGSVDNAVLWGELVSPNYFETLGIRCVLGRAFAEGEHAPNAILSYHTWQRRFGGDRAIVGRSVDLNRHTFTIVGVAPEGFRGAYSIWFAPEIWVSADANDLLVPEQRGLLNARGKTSFRLIGRLRANRSIEQTTMETAAVVQRLAREFPETNANLDAALFYERDARPEPDAAAAFKLAALVFLVLVGLVLLVACGNVANILLARATGRRREIAIRMAIGASRLRIARQFVTESLVLAALAGGVGLFLAAWATSLLARIPVPSAIPIVLDIAIDARVLILGIGLALLTSLIFGMAPAFYALRVDMVSMLKDGQRTGGSTRKTPLGSMLVVGQIAVSLTLLVAAGLFVRSLRQAERLPLGFDSRHAIVGTIDLALSDYDAASGRRLYRALLDRTAALPGVARAALAAPVPLEFYASEELVWVDGAVASSQRANGKSVLSSAVSTGYFETMRTRLVDGRDFTEADAAGAPLVAVINETMAKRLWPGTSALGRRFRAGAADAPSITVVGVAQDGKYRDVAEAPQPFLYLPLAQRYVASATLVVRTAGEPLSAVTAVRGAVRSLDPSLSLEDVKTLDALVVGRAMLPYRIASGFAGVLGGVALALAVMGLYGLVMFVVGQRTREIGIRMAIGATAGQVAAMVVTWGIRLAGIGILIGSVAAFALGRLVSSLMEVSSVDPLAYGAAALLMTAMAGAASYLPGRRAARLNPVLTLKRD
jgi:putative ABC transport system permease protein